MKHLKSFQIFNESLNSNTLIYYFLSTSSNFLDIEDEFLRFKDIRCLNIHPINQGIYKHFIKIDLTKDPELKPKLEHILNSKLIIERFGLKSLELWIKEEFFDKFKIKTYGNSVFYLIDDKASMELEKKNSNLGCRLDGFFWDIFYNEFHMNYEETQDFMKNLAEKYLKGKTPIF